MRLTGQKEQYCNYDGRITSDVEKFIKQKLNLDVQITNVY